MNAPSETRSLDRAIDILEILAGRGPSALHDLHKLSGLSKTTVRRLLGTLEKRDFVRRGISDGAYRVNVALPAHGQDTFTGRVARLVRSASQSMLELTRSIGWPSDLHIYVDGRMRIVESTHALSRFGHSKRDVCENELNLFVAASGLAYLSTLSDEQIYRKIQELQTDELWSQGRYGIPRSRLFQEIARARASGLGTRIISQTDSGGFNAVAAPLLLHSRCIGALSVWWPQSYLSPRSFIARHGEEMIQTARAISLNLSAVSQIGLRSAPADEPYRESTLS